MNRNNPGTNTPPPSGDAAKRRRDQAGLIQESNDYPEELYGILTQIMLYVKTMDEDYSIIEKRCRINE